MHSQNGLKDVCTEFIYMSGVTSASVGIVMVKLYNNILLMVLLHHM